MLWEHSWEIHTCEITAVQINRDSNGQGCNRGDGSRTLDGRWAKYGGTDRYTSKERTKDEQLSI